MAMIRLDPVACSFDSKASTPSIHTISRPFSSGCSTFNRMRVLAAGAGGLADGSGVGEAEAGAAGRVAGIAVLAGGSEGGTGVGSGVGTTAGAIVVSAGG